MNDNIEKRYVKWRSGPLKWLDRSTLGSVSGFGGLGGSEHHGGAPTPGQGYFAALGRANDVADELNKTRGLRRSRDPKRRWWQIWRRRGADS
jgi:hypothetical protein